MFCGEGAIKTEVIGGSVTKKFLTILKLITNEIVERRMSLDDVIERVAISEIDIISLQDDIWELEKLDTVSEEEIDMLKAFISYIMIKDTNMEREDIYSIIFGRGKRILWH